MSEHDEQKTPHDEMDPANQQAAEPDPDAVGTQDGSETYVDTGDASADSVAETDELQAQLEQARMEAQQYREQAARAQAEMENIRKRAERDTESARKFAIEKFASELLNVQDSMELGLKSAEDNHGDFDKLKEGMEMIHRMLSQTMEKVGIEMVNPEGETFDPNYHEAVATQPSDDLPPNTVASVMQKGYLLNGRVLRAAMVTVTQASE